MFCWFLDPSEIPMEICSCFFRPSPVVLQFLAAALRTVHLHRDLLALLGEAAPLRADVHQAALRMEDGGKCGENLL